MKLDLEDTKKNELKLEIAISRKLNITQYINK